MAKKHWIYIKRGLSEDVKHRAAMGECIWLYMHIIDRADWETGIAYDWKDREEAVDMGMAFETLRDQRQKLEKLDYIRCIQKQRGQDIQIMEWRNPREYGSEVRNPRIQGDASPLPSDFQGDAHGDGHGDPQDSSQPVTPTYSSESTPSSSASAQKTDETKGEYKTTIAKSDMPEWAFEHGEELTPSQIAAIEENSSRKWKYRESFPSELWPLADLVVKKFGPPIKTKKNNQVSLYLETIGSWHDVGCTISDWPRALEIVKAYSNPIVRITGMTDPLKLAMQERKNRKAPEERQPIREKQGISRDEALSRGLITHPKIGASS